MRTAKSRLCVPDPIHGSDQQGCLPCRLAVTITGHVPAVAFLLIMRVTTWLRLSRREKAWQTAEILMLRHQLAVPQRRQPRRPHSAHDDDT